MGNFSVFDEVLGGITGNPLKDPERWTTNLQKNTSKIQKKHQSSIPIFIHIIYIYTSLSLSLSLSLSM